jgi:hypothetical protein
MSNGLTKNMVKHRPVLIIAAFAALSAGCAQDPLGRHAISGTVNVDGAPLESGHISFHPTEGQATSGGAVVAAGKYTVPREGGLVPGKYKVSIHAPAPGTGGQGAASGPPGEAVPAPNESLPPEWNTASNHYIEVKPPGPFFFPFEVSTATK